MNRGRKVKFAITSTLIVLVILFLSLFVLMIYVAVNHNWGERESVKMESSIYQYRQIDTSTNRSSSGFITLLRQLNEDEFSFYEEEGNVFLISKVGATEYQCTGFCYCSDPETSRRLSSTFPLGLIYLAAAVTSMAAYHLAEVHFREKCAEDFQETCPGPSIQSTVEDCEVIESEELKEAEVVGEEEDILDDYVEKGNREKYMCRGNCVANIYKNNEYWTEDLPRMCHDTAKKFGCEKLFLETEIYVEKHDNYWYEHPLPLVRSRKAREECAKYNFISENLYEFCKKSSLKEVVVEDTHCCQLPEEELLKDKCGVYFDWDSQGFCHACDNSKHEFEKDTRPMCVSTVSNYDRWFIEAINPTVVCKVAS